MSKRIGQNAHLDSISVGYVGVFVEEVLVEIEKRVIGRHCQVKFNVMSSCVLFEKCTC
jgi:hypothetical protein